MFKLLKISVWKVYAQKDEDNFKGEALQTHPKKMYKADAFTCDDYTHEWNENKMIK